jgi:hypothetical protein
VRAEGPRFGPRRPGVALNDGGDAAVRERHDAPGRKGRATASPMDAAS